MVPTYASFGEARVQNAIESAGQYVDIFFSERFLYQN